MKTPEPLEPPILTPRTRGPEGPAARALAEAAARRREWDAKAVNSPREVDGRAGPEPVRFGDWENKGIASDF